MCDVPRPKDMDNIDYIRLKNDLNSLPESLQILFLFLLRENEKLNLQIDELKVATCKKCKYFDK